MLHGVLMFSTDVQDIYVVVVEFGSRCTLLSTSPCTRSYAVGETAQSECTHPALNIAPGR